ncbi:MAG: hypothetical protein JZU65_04715 [Chlorobium sp.]|jgi:hypothetical protein|nr:hypothetical protein [Chlorobium sp.]
MPSLRKLEIVALYSLEAALYNKVYRSERVPEAYLFRFFVIKVNNCYNSGSVTVELIWKQLEYSIILALVLLTIPD